MAAVAIQGGQSTGHGCFPPMPDIGPYAVKTFVNGRPVQLTGMTAYGPTHNCGPASHPLGKITSGSSKTRVEGAPVARIGDKIACGDTVAKGSSNTFVA